MAPVFAAARQRFGNVETYRGIHASLNIEDNIGRMIRKERFTQYPAGTAFTGNISEAYARDMLI